MRQLMLYRMRWLFIPLLIVALSPWSFAQPANPPAPEPIPPQQLQRMFRRELGDFYDPGQAETYLAAHQAVEKYFAAGNTDARKAIVSALEVLGLDPNIIGPLVRIRSTWPQLTPGGVYYVNERMGPIDVHYFLGVPRTYDRAQPWPLVIKLPTADAFVGENKPNADDVQRIYSDWMSQELARHPDALCIMPLLNLDDLWGPSYAGMNRVMGPILHVIERVNVDPARVYLIGHSMSGHAAWNIPLHYPTYFAATNPLAGSASNDWQRLRLRNLANLLVVPWHDTNDELIKVSTSRQLVNLLKRFKIDVEYLETKGVGHVPTDEIADECYAKMIARRRTLYPKQLTLQSNRPESMFNRIDWLQVYQPMNPGEEKKLYFNRRPGSMKLMSNAWSAQASINGNRIDMTTDNVALMRIYLNDRIVNFRQPVTVVVNRRIRFEGMVTPSIEGMLKDQTFLGRGWRYFGGFIDIDLTVSPTTRPTVPATLPLR